jgi:hypothetical protein
MCISLYTHIFEETLVQDTKMKSKLGNPRIYFQVHFFYKDNVKIKKESQATLSKILFSEN